MNVLSIDTTTNIARAAIKKVSNTNFNNSEIIQQEISNEVTHSEKLLPLIHETLRQLDLTLHDISLLACINGPGSFTGIRIGLATIKAFAQVENLPIYAMSSLEAIAFSTYVNNILNKTSSSAYIASLIDAKNDRVYFGVYKLSLDLNEKLIIETVLNISNEKIDDACNLIKESLKFVSSLNSEIFFSGDCTNKFSENIKNTKLNISNIFELYPTPADIISSIDLVMDKNKYMYNAFNFDAIYARLSQAERVKNNEN